MTTLFLNQPLAFESIPSAPVSAGSLLKAIRSAIMVALQADPILAQYNLPFTYRPTRKFIALPSVTFFDYGSSGDDQVPLQDRTYQFDVWTQSDLDMAEDVADRITLLFDYPTRIARNLPAALSFPGQEGNAAFMQLINDLDAITEDADLVRKTLIFRLLCYQLN